MIPNGKRAISVRLNVDLELLRTLVAFADTGSFKLASQLVFRSQPAVSMQMKRLERLIGQQLFERQGREVVLTTQGQHMVSSARKLLAAHDQMVEQLRGEEPFGEVRIGMPDDYAPLALPHILHRFDEYYPAVSLNILANTTPVLEDRLKRGELDLAVLATLSPQADDVILATEPIVWVSSEDSDVHMKRPLVLALFSDESPIYRATMAALGAAERSHDEGIEFRIGILTKSSSVLLAVAASGFAVATMARCVVPSGFRLLKQADGFPELGNVQIVMRASTTSQSPAIARMTERIIETFSDGALDDGGPGRHSSPTR